MENKFDLIVIGAGPGGYAAAIRAAQLGLKTAVAEKRDIGGTCLNRGCIPAKAMIHASSLYREMKEAKQFGILADGVRFDYGKILSYKEETTAQLCQGIENLLQANGVTILRGKAVLLPGHKVQVEADGRKEVSVYEAEHVLLAAGSKPLRLPIPGLSLPGVLTSDELFQLKEAPESLVIIGGGVISVEFASVYAALGTKVTIVEALPRIVPNMDKEISQSLKMILKKRGIAIHTAASVQAVEQEGKDYTCVFLEKEKEVKVSGQYILCAVGRCPETDGLFAEGAVPAMERGRVLVDAHFCTSIDNVYAIGDMIFGTQLAHAASAQGIFVAEELAGRTPSICPDIVPGCIYTDPEIASAGLTEDGAKEKGISFKTGKFIMSANGKSLITREERGFIKVVIRQDNDQILGAQMMCARATDMIGEFATAIVNGLTAAQMVKAMRAHPTYNEGITEALEDAAGEAIHIMPKKKK